MNVPHPFSHSSGHHQDWSRINRLLLLAAGYLLLFNIGLHFHLHYESGILILLGSIHLLGSIELNFLDKPKSALGAATRRTIQLSVFALAVWAVITFLRHTG